MGYARLDLDLSADEMARRSEIDVLTKDWPRLANELMAEITHKVSGPKGTFPSGVTVREVFGDALTGPGIRIESGRRTALVLPDMDSRRALISFEPALKMNREVGFVIHDGTASFAVEIPELVRIILAQISSRPMD